MSKFEITRRALVPMTLAAAACQSVAAQEATPAIHVRSVGEGARVWVLVHPFGASGRFWEARAAALASAHGVRVLSADLPSHGRSRIVRRFDYDSASTALAGALAAERENIELIVGASSGGLAALKLAAAWQKRVAAIGVGASFSAPNVANMNALSRVFDAGSEQWVAAFLEQGDAQRAAIQRHYGDLAALGEAPLITPGECAALTNRTLILNGANDDFFSRDSAHALADAIPGALLTFVTGAGHLEPLAALYRDATWGAIAAFASSPGAT